SADLDSDGLSDLVLLDRATGARVRIFLAQLDGGFLEVSGFDAGSSFLLLELGDVDGDGVLDVVVGDFIGRTLRVGFLGANGQVSSVLTAPVSHEIRDLAVGDLDGDGRADVAIVGDAAGSLSILRSM